jgi:ABC-type multidrug transport system fused ATPase/permease subunit
MNRVRRWWETTTFGSAAPGRRLAALALLGLVTGLGEAAVVLLIVALASHGSEARLPLIDSVPGSPWALAGLALGAVAVLALAHLGSAVATARAGVEVRRNVQALLVRAHLAAPWQAQSGFRAAELQDLVTVRSSVLARGTQVAAQGVSASLNLAVLLGVAALLSAGATAGLVASVLAVLVASRAFRERRRRATRAAWMANAEVATEVAETASAARDLRVFGVSDVAADRLVDRIDDAADRDARMQVIQVATPPLTRDATVAALVVCLALVVTGTGISLPVLGATVLLVLRALTQAQSLATVGVILQEREDHVARIRALLAEWRPPPGGITQCPPLDSITLAGVGFTHPGADRPALEGIDLELTRGELVGVVGRTGAGKTTLASVVLGLLEPQRGTIAIAGVPLAQIDPSDWRARTAWVGQAPHLISGSVADNIRYLRDLDTAAVREAALAAGLATELARWPDGIDHEAGAGGSSLSGGQRQRVALARALAGSPQLLVLDEPTSALDAHAEAALGAALSAARRGRIVVVIAHRPSTVRACDRIAVVEDGRIVACAPPASLEADNAYYREIVTLSHASGTVEVLGAERQPRATGGS